MRSGFTPIVFLLSLSVGCGPEEPIEIPDSLMCHNPLDPESAVTITVSGDAVEVHDAHGDEAGVCDFTICHLRCGDPHDVVTMHVMDQALGFHLGHGDTLGACDNGCRTLDFETTPDEVAVVGGQQLSRTFEANGVTIRAFRKDGSNPGVPIAFDTTTPTGGDVDLGTPNEAYGGPGIGAGGADNTTALGMVLVKAEDEDDDNNDGVIDTPDDQGNGALLQFDFAEPTCIRSVSLLDIDTNESPVLTTRDRSGIRLYEIGAVGDGDNSVQVVDVNACDAYFFDIELDGSGAVARLEYCAELPTPTPDLSDTGDTGSEACEDEFGDTGLGLPDDLGDVVGGCSGDEGGTDTLDPSETGGCSSTGAHGPVVVWLLLLLLVARRRK